MDALEAILTRQSVKEVYRPPGLAREELPQGQGSP